MKRQRGRPPKIDRKKISVDQAVQITSDFWAQFGKKGYSKGYIYNMLSSGKLHKEVCGKGVLLYEDEVKEKLCG